ncbi:MAG: hypothetical protein DRJ05_09635 [Bacteroidetes bacterium]|nr:MAG: hypothetical protein DRJ05_09635 [Bacteroidota bacterium]
MNFSRTILQLSIFFIGIYAGNTYSQFYDMVLEDMSITTYTEPFVADNSITASNFTVTETGDVTFKAGNSITLLPGFSVEEGGLFHAYISDEKNGAYKKSINKDELNNFPNPFGNLTTISFLVFSPGNVKLTVINPVGQTIETLFDENITDTGVSHEVKFYANGLSKGVYFYKLETADNTVIKKMILSNP